MKVIVFETWYMWKRSFLRFGCWAPLTHREWLDRKIEGRKRGNVNKVIEYSSCLKRTDRKELRDVDNMILEKIQCKVHKKGAAFELMERTNVIQTKLWCHESAKHVKKKYK
jgi:hypothetical protein